MATSLNNAKRESECLQHLKCSPTLGSEKYIELLFIVSPEVHILANTKSACEREIPVNFLVFSEQKRK